MRSQPVEKVTRSVSEGLQHWTIFEKQLPRSRCGFLQIPFFNGLIARIRNGVFRSVAKLEQAIHDDIAHRNAPPRTFVWTKTAEENLAKVTRARSALNQFPSE